MSFARIFWIDLEMTGLDPANDRIIEIASLITDLDLRVLAEGPELAVHQSDEVLANMNQWCKVQHGKSGLTERVRNSTVTLAQAERQSMEFLKAHGCEGAPLGGNSVHMDRLFLEAHMPKLAAALDPVRLVDVSTLKELMRRWNPSAAASLPAKGESHRALQDIRESIAELAHYKAMGFRH